jgi:D-ribose pyranase
MKKTPLINAPVSRVIATMGHTDALCIADAGLPISSLTERIDLAVKPGVPPFLDVLGAVLEELVVERAVVAEEIRKKSPAVLEGIRRLLGDITIDFVPHEEFKTLIERSKAVVRTGEYTPYANVILYSGVPF